MFYRDRKWMIIMLYIENSILSFGIVERFYCMIFYIMVFVFVFKLCFL